MSTGDHCTHTATPTPQRPVPDWTGTCPDCGERVTHDGRGGFVARREVNARLAAQTHLTLDPEDAAVLRESLWHSLQRGDLPDDDRRRMDVLRERLSAR
jgi:hypothetical protein